MAGKLRVLLTFQHKDILLKEDCSFLYGVATSSSLDPRQRSLCHIVISSIIGGRRSKRRRLVCLRWRGCNIVFVLFVYGNVFSTRNQSSGSIVSLNSYCIPCFYE